MSTKEKAVRDAAMALHGAITEAKAAGLTVAWPSSPDDLPGIAISETGKARAEAPAKPAVSKPTPLKKD